MESGERLALQLQRLLVRRRFGAMVLLLTGGRRVPLSNREEVRVHRALGTIEVTTRGDVRDILFEDLLAIELRPRSRPGVPKM